MDFFAKVGDKVTELGGAASGKAKGLAEVARLSGQIKTLEGEITALYTEIGKKMFESRLDTATPKDFTTEYAKIIEKQQQIAESKAKLAEAKGTQTCPVCGEEVEKGASFCMKCGAKMGQ